MQYDEVITKLKRIVNRNGDGRNNVAKFLWNEYNIQTTDYQIRKLIHCIRQIANPKRKFTIESWEKKALLTLKVINGETPPDETQYKKAPIAVQTAEPIDVTVTEEEIITMKDNNLESQLRTRYDIKDENWIPVAVWGDMRNPMVKWERKKNASRHEEYLDKIELRDLPHSIQVTPNDELEERIAVLSMRDAHFGLLTEHPEPYETYDLDEATKTTIAAGTYLMRAAVANGVTKLVIPIGSDLLHVDGSSNATTKGTRQDTNSFWWEAFDAAINAMNQIINAAKDIFDEVIIPIEPGNHDASLSRAVGIAMKSAWSNQSNVSILDNPETLKRITFGNTHLFMHHGNSMKPALLQSWIYAKHPDVIKPGSYVEVLCGHYHHRSLKKLRESGDYFEFGGMMIRITPALCPASNWSESQGYVSSPGAELTIYDEVGFVSLHEWTPNRT